MTESERVTFRQILKSQQKGWDYLEKERRSKLRQVVTKEAILALELSFGYSQSLPPRTESGLVEFYKAMMKATNR